MTIRVSHGNGVLVEMDGRRFRFDPRRVLENETSMISHAHSDHLPTSFKRAGAVCSAITRDFVRVRRRREIEAETDERVDMLEAGHIAGSNMFLVRGEKRVLYTGDFCTRKKEHTSPARPRKCDMLVMEATYGLPRYVFPDHGELMGVVRDWIEDLLSRGRSVVLFAYPLGKAQEVASCLKGMPLTVDPAIAVNNEVLNGHGYELPTAQLDGTVPDTPVVHITSTSARVRGRLGELAKRRASTAGFSGWALDAGFAYQSDLDEAFPLSDHCGYDELMRFVDKCGPEKVFTHHGFAKELAARIRAELDIHAQPLVARQRTLDHFC